MDGREDTLRFPRPLRRRGSCHVEKERRVLGRQGLETDAMSALVKPISVHREWSVVIRKGKPTDANVQYHGITVTFVLIYVHVYTYTSRLGFDLQVRHGQR
jgi:hypothetical protein